MNFLPFLLKDGPHTLVHLLIEEKALAWLGLVIGALYGVERQMLMGFPPSNFQYVKSTMHSMVYLTTDSLSSEPAALLNRLVTQQELLWGPVIISALVGGVIGLAVSFVGSEIRRRRAPKP